MKLRRKPEEQQTADKQISIVTSDNAIKFSPAFARDTLLAIAPPVPAALMPHIDRFDAQLLPGRRVLELDGAQFESDVEEETRRQQSQPTPEATWTYGEVVARLFGGDVAAFEAAAILGFPSRSGARLNGVRLEGYWRARVVREWASRIAETAAALTR